MLKPSCIAGSLARRLMNCAAALNAPVLAGLIAVSLSIPGVSVAATKKPADDERRANSQTVRSGGFSFRIESLPSWVEAVRGEGEGRPQNSSLHYALVDDQIRVDGREAEFFRHAVRVVSEPAGLAFAAQIMAEFDPSFQKLSFHRLGIWRGGRYINKLDQKKLALLRRETRLEDLVYDGKVTASTVLDDVRVGDRIEYAYTLRGANPVFEGKFVHTAWAIAQSGPIAHYRLRLVARPERRIFHRTGADFAVAESERDGMRETIFSRRDVAQFPNDQSIPESAFLADQIQLSEFADWSEVARWGEKLFAATAAPSAAVRQRAETIRSVVSTPEERLRLALDFVQNEVRYFGMEMGPNSHHPADPGKVIEQRFGDCKDKVSLLIGLLRELGISASPVLVSARYRDQAAAELPGPLAFDHVIAQAEIDGRTYWLDGTRSHQTGPVTGRQSTGFGKGLLLQAASSALSELPGNQTENRITVEETFRIARIADDPPLESRITYFGELAEFIRQSMATQPLAQLETQFASDYARLYPGIRSTSAPRFEEVPDRNAIRIVQQFAMPKFWSFPDERVLVGEVWLWGVAQAAKHPDELARRTPLRIKWPGIHRHIVTMEYPEDVYQSSSSSRFDDGDANFSYSVTYDSSPRRVQIRAELLMPKDSIGVADWQAYSAKIKKIMPRFSSSISVPALRLDQSEKLKKDLREMEEAIRAGKSGAKSITKAQVAARFRRITLTAQLESGRLNPVLRAQALRERGIQFDHIGAPEKATADFEEALRLDPADARNHTAAAVNAFILGRDSLAIDRVKSALALAPSDLNSYDVRAYADYFSGNYSAARESLKKLLGNPAAAEKSYSAIWLYLTTRRLGEEGAEAARRHLPTAAVPSWPYPILQMFIGSGSYEQALKMAREGTQDPSRQCELYFYAGEKALLDGDLQAARDFFRKTIDTGVVEFNEYAMAKRRLEAPELK